jgi:hypothetical protein
MSSTVVTCYYKIKSKHTFEKYDEWISIFLTNIDCNLFIFTSPDLKDYLLEKRQGILREKTFIICIELNDLYLSQKYLNKWNYQYSIDSSNPNITCGRTKECYIIWNSKLWFLKNAIEINPFNSDKFVWTDIGCLRNTNCIHYLKNYPIYHLISNDKIDIILLYPITNKMQLYFVNETHFSGAIFGSHKSIILKLYDIFYKRLDKFISNNYFIGCDQQTISSVYNTNSELFNPINPNLFIEKICMSQKIWKSYNISEYFLLWVYYTVNLY